MSEHLLVTRTAGCSIEPVTKTLRRRLRVATTAQVNGANEETDGMRQDAQLKPRNRTESSAPQ
jgi:hypothetical protein